MFPKIVLIPACSTAVLISACIPMAQYTALENQLEDSRLEKAQVEKKLESRDIELKKAEKRLRRMEIELGESETVKNKYSRKIAELNTQSTYLKRINSQQAENINTLKQELNKKKSVIQLQEKVIQLFDDTKKTIESSLKDQIAAQEIEVVEAEDRLKVIFIDKILFDSGSVKINPRGKDLLLIVTESLKDNKNQDILVEGHTDNVPLTAELKKRFPSNWELSTARAAAVVRFFQQEGGIEPERLSARGYSFYRSVAPNNTEMGRHQNRRIEIILEPNERE